MIFGILVLESQIIGVEIKVWDSKKSQNKKHKKRYCC